MDAAPKTECVKFQVRLETKLAALDGIESDWRASQDSKNDGAGGYGPVTSSWLSYGSSYIGTIVENLQLDIGELHDDIAETWFPVYETA